MTVKESLWQVMPVLCSQVHPEDGAKQYCTVHDNAIFMLLLCDMTSW